MTGWQALTGIMCPSMLAQYLNRISEGGLFSGDYIDALDNHCPYDTATDHALCNKCWMDFFLRGDVK